MDCFRFPAAQQLLAIVWVATYLTRSSWTFPPLEYPLLNMSITITAPSSSAEYTGNLSSPVLPASALHLQGALSPELDTPEIHSKFESALQKIDPTLEIRRLNSVIIELKTLFRKLFLDFGKHDREAKRLGVRSDGLDGVQPLAPQWDVLRKVYRILRN